MRDSIAIAAIVVALLVGVAGGYYVAGLTLHPQARTATVTSSTTYTTTATSTVTVAVPVTTTVTSTVTVTPTTLFMCNETLLPYTTISQPAGQYDQYSYTVNYPGYVEVFVYGSTTGSTYVEISGESNNGISYSSGQVTVGTSGSLAYPVLPGSVYVYVGNHNLISGATEEIAIIYFYYAPSCNVPAASVS